MGVPAFYRWLREKYRKCIADVNESADSLHDVDSSGSDAQFDALYIDMNGIIHPCVHPEDIPPPETEEEMFIAIFAYIDRLVAAVKPSRVLYLAIDGVAPRAKMNQQRSRRFKTASDMAEEEAVEDTIRSNLRAKGQKVPPKRKATFDHNVITPGTRFMDRLSDFLRYHIHARVNSHPLWRNLRVILSDASVPGEGEHKIMEFIRQQRAQPGYSPAMRHCLHGLDADLIMLGLATHEPYFTILREDVLGKPSNKCFICGQEGHRAGSCTGTAAAIADSSTDRKNIIQRKPLQFLHLYILREYLDLEFQALKGILPFSYDLERLIDDFVFMCFFVGNDFLPHLPSMDIREGAIDLLLALYRHLLPSLGGYLTNNGDVDLSRVDVLLSKVGDVEDEIFRRRRAQEERDKRRELQRQPSGQSNDGGKSGAALSEKQRSLNAATEEARKVMDESIAGFRNAASTAETANKRMRTESGKATPAAPGTADNRSAAAALRASLIAPPAESTVVTVAGSKRTREEMSSSEPAEPTAVADSKHTREEMSSSEPADTAEPSPPGESADIVAAEGATPPAPSPSEEALLEEALEDGLLEEEVSTAISSMLKSAVLKALLERRTHNDVVDEVQLGTPGWRERYYQNKFGRENGSNPTYIQEMCRKYTEGLVWVFKYYYEGVASWNWYYPYHYAPFASSLRNLDSFEPIKFDLGKPFRPLDQLMSVLPARSSHALPRACAKLMTDASSPIKHFYPEHFDTDPNGKKFSWQWVVLLPFIDEKALISAIDSVVDTFSDDEKRRNLPGNELVFVHAATPIGKFLVPLVPSTTTTATNAAASDPGAAAPVAKIPVVMLRPHMGDPQSKGLSAQCVSIADSPASKRGLKAIAIGGTFNTPAASLLASITDVKVVSVTYCAPPRKKHICTLLPGVDLPLPTLDPLEDDPSNRVPKLTRGMNIADLAAAISLYGNARGRGDDRTANALLSGSLTVGAGGATMAVGGYYGTAVAYQEPQRYDRYSGPRYPVAPQPPPPAYGYGRPPQSFAPQQMGLLNSVGARPPSHPRGGSHQFFGEPAPYDTYHQYGAPPPPPMFAPPYPHSGSGAPPYMQQPPPPPPGPPMMPPYYNSRPPGPPPGYYDGRDGGGGQRHSFRGRR